MATNQLLPFAAGENPNVVDFETWNDLPERNTGFQAGIARSGWANYIFKQGGLAGYILGQLIVDQLNQDATLDPDTLYTNWKSAIAKFIPENVADGSIDAKKLLDASISFAKLASTAIATTEEAKAGEVNNKLMTPQLVAQAIAEQLPPAIPTGMLLPFAGTEVPEGFLLCNGANISRTDYAALFAVIGEKWGAGDGSTTFTLPNFNDRFIEGTTDTSKVGQYLEAGAPNITGYIPVAFKGGSAATSGAFVEEVDTSNRSASAGGGSGYYNITFNAQNGSNIYHGETIQPDSVYSLMIIKA